MSSITKAYSISMAGAKKGGRRWSPPGGYNPPPTEGVRSVLDIQPHRFQIRPDQITKGESERPSSLCKPRLLFPSLFLSPGGWGPPESATKFARSASCWVSWADFLLFWHALQKWHRKNIEKNAKIEDFGLPKPSQNPPKTPPKSMSQKTSKFSLIFNRFLPLVAKAEPWFCAHGHSFLRFLHNWRVRLWHAFWKPQPCQKPFQNEVRTL